MFFSPGRSVSARRSLRPLRPPAPTSRSSTVPRPPKPNDVAERVRQSGRRALVVQADVSDATSCAAMVSELDRHIRAARRARQHGLALRAGPVRRARRGNSGRDSSSVDLNGSFFCVAGGRACHAADRRRTHHQLLGLGGRQRTAALSGFRGLLRRQGRREGARPKPWLSRLPPTRFSSTRLRRDRFSRHPARATKSSRPSSDATPLGRWGGSEEIVKAVMSLMASDFITGETIRVDGGRHLR